MTTLPQHITELVAEYRALVPEPTGDVTYERRQRDRDWQIRLIWHDADGRPAWRCFHDGYVHQPWGQVHEGYSGPIASLDAAYDELARGLRECIADLKEGAA